MRCLLSTLILFSLVGCRSQTTTMTNPFLAPSRVPAPPTRTPVVGTAQPYYQGVPTANASVYGAPSTGFVPGVPVVPGAQPMSQPTFAPQPGVGTGPPNGWAPAPQPGAQPMPAPYGASMNNVLPNNIQTASAMWPTTTPAGQVQVQSDQQALRFDTAAFQHLQPNASVLPIGQQGASPYSVQPASYQPTSYQTPAPQFAPAVVSTNQPRAVRISPVSTGNLSSGVGSNDGASSNVLPSRDGFRPQSSQRVRKPS